MSNTARCCWADLETARLLALAEDLRVLELGTYWGHTATRLANVARCVWTVDHHRGDAYVGLGDSLAPYLTHLESTGNRERIISVIGDFVAVCEGLRSLWWGLVLVDGDHTYRATREACELAKDLVADRGMVAVHDFGRWQVAPAARDSLGEPTELTETLAVWSMAPSAWAYDPLETLATAQAVEAAR